MCSSGQNPQPSNDTFKLTRLLRYDTGTISGILAMPYWLQEFTTPGNDGKLTASQNSLIVSILSAGTFLGALSAAPLADMMGRRLGLMFAAGCVFNLGIICQTAATSQLLFISGRFSAGVGVGLISAISKLVQARVCFGPPAGESARTRVR